MSSHAADTDLSASLNALCTSLLDASSLPSFLIALTQQAAGHIGSDAARVVLKEGSLRYGLRHDGAQLSALHEDDSATRWILERGEPLNVSERARLAPELDLNWPEADYASFLGVPIASAQEPYGALYALSRAPRAFGGGEVRVLETFAALAALAVSQGRLQSRLEDSQRTLVRFALIDPLTNLASQRQFDYMLRREWQRTQSDVMPLAILQLEPDHFEVRQGRLGGPPEERDAIHRLARLLDALLLRPSDLVARLEGARFVILLPATNLPGARAIAARLQRDLQSLAIAHPQHLERHLTLSIGVAAHQPLEPESFLATPDELLAKAEQALKEAKAGGGNRAVSLV